MNIDFTDLDELDRQYDIIVSVPDIYTYAKSAMLQSEEVRLNSEHYFEFAYGDAPLQNFDFFPASDDSPLLVFIHGGYWRQFDKSLFSSLASDWNEIGVSVAVLNYRLAPAVRMTDIVADVRQAIGALWLNAGTFGFDNSNIVISGHSAGGHLTAMMLATDWPAFNSQLPIDLVKAGVSISGIHDLAPFERAPFIENTLQLTSDEVERYSPARLQPTTEAPLITCVGGQETSAFHAQNTLIAQAWPGVFKEDIPSPGTNHVEVFNELGDKEAPLFKATLELFET